MLKNNYGKTEKEIRNAIGLPLSAFQDSGISPAALSAFENGKSEVNFEKLKVCLNILKVPLDSFMDLAESHPIFKGYGVAFQILREQRSFEFDVFKSLGISPYIFQMFEEGKVMLPFDIIDASLQLMHVSLSDFSYIVNKGQQDHFIELFDKIEFYDSIGSAPKLEEIFEEANQYPDYRLIALSSKSHLRGLSQEEVEEVGDFLIGIDIWTNVGVSVFINTLTQLSTTMILSVVNDFIKNFELYREDIILRRNITRALVLVSMRMMDNGEDALASQILESSRQFLFHKDCYASSLYTFALGYHLYYIGKIEEGVSKMQEILHFFDLIGDKITENELQALFQRISNNEPSLI